MYQRLVCDSFHYAPPWDAQSLEDRLAALDEDLPRVAWLYERPDTSTFRYRVFNMVECLQHETPQRVAASWFTGDEIDALISRLAELDVLVTYGRDVGYKIEQETFDKSITDISATKIRKEMGLT
jgi:hypothetical protein